MAKALPSDRQIIEALGGFEEVAAELQLKPRAVKGWTQKDRGIAWPHRAKVADLAKKKRVRIPADFRDVRRLEQAA